MRDLQSEGDPRGVALERVGVTGLRLPVTVLARSRGVQQTIGTFALWCRLEPESRGAHMSRFVWLINNFGTPLSIIAVRGAVMATVEKQEVRAAGAEVAFPFCMVRKAPATGALSKLCYDCRILVEYGCHSARNELAVRVPVCMVCPCSREIAKHGAHGQRAYVDLAVGVLPPIGREPAVWLEELIELVERCAPSPVYPLLKRPDEAKVTEASFERAALVEDLCRDVVLALRRTSGILSYSVRVTSAESIHDHAAFAEATST